MKFGKVIRKAVAACPYVECDFLINWVERSGKIVGWTTRTLNSLSLPLRKKRRRRRNNNDQNRRMMTKLLLTSVSIVCFFPYLIASLEKEKQFFRQLTESVARVDTFFHQTQVQYIVEVKSLIEEVKKVDMVIYTPSN